MSKFWQGYVISICVQQLTQDLIGKERYLKSVDLLWVDTHWSVWAGLICFLLAMPYIEKYLEQR